MSPDAGTDLHAHCQALRFLARALVGEGDADDLVQDAALAALREPEQPRSLGAWLNGVLRFLAHKHRRGERRRTRREQAVARTEAVPPHDRALVQGDSLRRPTDHVLALPSPTRWQPGPKCGNAF